MNNTVNATKPTSAVQQAIDLANAKAAETAANQPQTVEMIRQPDTGNGIASYVAPRPKTLDDLSSNGLNVDNFVKVGEHGLELKGKDGLIEKIRVAIDTNPTKGIQVFEGVRFGNPAIYFKTYDGAKCASGGSWADAVTKAQRVDPSVRPYEGADLTMTTLEDVKNIKGTVVANKGSVLGHSTSVTNKANLVDFIAKVKDAGLRDKVVEVIIASEKKTNQRGNVWGLLTFELVGEYVAQ